MIALLLLGSGCEVESERVPYATFCSWVDDEVAAADGDSVGNYRVFCGKRISDCDVERHIKVYTMEAVAAAWEAHNCIGGYDTYLFSCGDLQADTALETTRTCYQPVGWDE